MISVLSKVQENHAQSFGLTRRLIELLNFKIKNKC